MHRNSFAVRAHPLVRPMVAIPPAWLTLLGHVLLGHRVGFRGPVRLPSPYSSNMEM